MNEEKQGKIELSIGGQTRTLRFSYKFLGLLFEQFSAETIDQTFQKEFWRSIPIVTQFGLLAGGKANNLPADFDEDMAAEWLSDVAAPIHAQIWEAYQHSMGFLSIVFRPITTEAIPVKTNKKASIGAA